MTRWGLAGCRRPALLLRGCGLSPGWIVRRRLQLWSIRSLEAISDRGVSGGPSLPLLAWNSSINRKCPARPTGPRRPAAWSACCSPARCFAGGLVPGRGSLSKAAGQAGKGVCPPPLLSSLHPRGGAGGPLCTRPPPPCSPAVKCSVCKSVSDTYDPYLDVALEIRVQTPPCSSRCTGTGRERAGPDKACYPEGQEGASESCCLTVAVMLHISFQPLPSACSFF